MRQRSWDDQQLTEAVSSSKSLAGVLRQLGLRPVGGNYKTIKQAIQRLELDQSHFTGQGWNSGHDFVNPAPTKPLNEWLTLGSNISSFNLKKRLLKEGYFEHKCYKCGLAEWNGSPIPIELEHINGVNNDNRIENLTILCPNCHAQTPTYRGKNINRV